MKRSALHKTIIFSILTLIASFATAQDTNVGFTVVHISNGTEPDLTAGIWSADDGTKAAC